MTEADVHAGQLWSEQGTPYVWRVVFVVRDHLIGDIYETNVTLQDDFDPRNIMRIPASVLVRDYTLEARL